MCRWRSLRSGGRFSYRRLRFGGEREERTGIYNDVGSVKGHPEFTNGTGFVFFLLKGILFFLSTKARSRILRWTLVPPAIYSVFSTMILASNSPLGREAERPI